jgi:iron complex outermembrane recepter protein
MAAATLALAAAAPVMAQARDTAMAARDSALVLRPLEVSASILPVAGPAIGSAVPARVTTFAGSALRAWGGGTLVDALAAQSGASLYDDLGSGFKQTLVTRGFAASPVVGLPQGVSVFIDGVPVNEPDARQVNFDLLPLEHVERVELLSGTASLLGPNALGGAVNLITRRAEPGPRQGSIEVAAGSFGAVSADAHVSGGAGDWSVYAGGGYTDERGWRDTTSARQGNVLVNAGRYGPDRGIGVQGIVATSYAETAGSLPLSVYVERPRVNLTAGDFEDLLQAHLAVSGYAPVGAGRGSFRLYLRGHDAERFNVNQASDPDVRSLSENRTLGASLDWRGAVDAAAPTSLGYRIGASGSVNRTAIRIFAERIDPGLTTHVRSPIADAGLFGMADLTRGRLTLSAGARLDAVRVPFRNLLDAERDTTSAYIELNPRAGASWMVSGDVVVFGSVGRSFRPPAVIELACADPENPCPLPFALGDDPPLDPVTAVTYELGGSFDRGGFGATAAVYRTDVSDDIFLFPYDDDDEPEGSTIDGYFANIDATRRAGVELDVRYRSARGHEAFAAWAYTRATFRAGGFELFSIREEGGGAENEVRVGNHMPLVPDHTVRAGADARLSDALRVGATGRYTGRRWLRGDEANTDDALDGYVVADLRAGVAWRGWGVNAVVRNVFDNRYAAFGTYNIHQAAGDVLERFLTPGQPRSLRIAVRRDFGGR